MASVINPQILLTRYSYSDWVKHVSRVLEIEGLKIWIGDDIPKIEGTTGLENIKLKQSQSRAAGILKSYISDEIESEISTLSDSKVIWDTLKTNL